MKATELRLGNLVENQKGNIEPILGLYTIPNYVEVTTENRVGLAGDFKPIPLTEEWLERFGFEKVSGDYVRYDLKATEDVYIVYADDYSCGLFNSKESEANELGVIPNWETIKHVHQLQNLYFALTGEELTIKE